MNKTELMLMVTEKSGYDKQCVDKVIKAFEESITESLSKGEKIQMIGFGTFEISERAEREGRNPQSGETMIISACKMPKFKPSKVLKDAVNA